jgi:peptide/nickel transport system ATP-binding protein
VCAEQDPPLEPHRDGLTAACWHPLPADHAVDALEQDVADAFEQGADVAQDLPNADIAAAPPLLVGEGVSKEFHVGRTFLLRPRSVVRAVDDVTLDVRTGEAFGVVGESGSGKTTLGRMLVALETPTAGHVRLRLNGTPVDVQSMDRPQLRRSVQMIFQDPYESLNPRMTIGDIVGEPLDVLRLGTRGERYERVTRMLSHVGLVPTVFVPRYPHELSGGQRQRVAIARAMIVEPRFVVADEPTSMLDVSVRTGIMQLLLRFKRETGVSYLYITHDVAVARYLCDRIAVMRRGRVVELGLTDAVLERPLHPYTRALIAAVPVPDPAYRRPDPATFLAGVAADETSGEHGAGAAEQGTLVEREPAHWVAQ